MHTKIDTIRLLKEYKPHDIEEKEFVKQTLNFINNHEYCFSRSQLEGHITGSAWILDPTYKYVLLTHHKKLNCWYQLGGHSDGDPDTMRVAFREAKEESGLTGIESVSNQIFSIDIQEMPEYKNEPKHQHFDLVFLFIADMKEPLIVSSESKEVKWVKINQVKSLVDDKLINKLISKTLNISTSTIYYPYLT